MEIVRCVSVTRIYYSISAKHSFASLRDCRYQNKKSWKQYTHTRTHLSPNEDDTVESSYSICFSCKIPIECENFAGLFFCIQVRLLSRQCEKERENTCVAVTEVTVNWLSLHLSFLYFVLFSMHTVAICIKIICWCGRLSVGICDGCTLARSDIDTTLSKSNAHWRQTKATC